MDENDIVGVYSTQKLAKEYEIALDNKLSKLSFASNYIQEFELDKAPKNV